MKQVEMEAVQRGYHYIYLFTPDQQLFYQSCGYKLCEPISQLGVVAARISSQAIDSLSKLMSKKSLKISSQDAENKNNNKNKKNNENDDNDQNALSSYENDAMQEDQYDCVWLRKMLVEHTNTTHFTDREADVRAMIVELKKKLVTSNAYCSISNNSSNANVFNAWCEKSMDVLFKMLIITNKKNGEEDGIVIATEDNMVIQDDEEKEIHDELKKLRELELEFGSFDGCILDMEIERQVGPTCGLAALRMLNRYHHQRKSSKNNKPSHQGQTGGDLISQSNNSPHLVAFSSAAAAEEEEEGCDQDPTCNLHATMGESSNSSHEYDQDFSLLQHALKQNMTYEGEIFSAHYLVRRLLI
jgi:hypothetical protein